jgi:hypothetical protein
MFRSTAFEEWSSLAQGVGFALAADIAMARFLPGRRTAVAAVGLVAAAAVYPLSRRRWGIDTGETITLTAACAVAGAATWLPARTARRVVGVGWAAHAVYDAAFTHDASITRLPPTYAAACAGADIAMATRLILVRR